MSIPCDEVSAASVSVWWQVRWVTEGSVTGTLEPFQGSKPLIIKVGCLLPTMVLQNKFGRQFLWHDALFSQAARCFYITMRPFKFHKSLTHLLGTEKGKDVFFQNCKNQKCIALYFLLYTILYILYSIYTILDWETSQFQSILLESVCKMNFYSLSLQSTPFYQSSCNFFLAPPPGHSCKSIQIVLLA